MNLPDRQQKASNPLHGTYPVCYQFPWRGTRQNKNRRPMTQLIGSAHLSAGGSILVSDVVKKNAAHCRRWVKWFFKDANHNLCQKLFKVLRFRLRRLNNDFIVYNGNNQHTARQPVTDLA